MGAAELLSPSPNTPAESRVQFISLVDIFAVLWSGKWLILSATLLFGAGATFVTRFIQKQYEASVVVSVVSEDTGSSSLGALGALASQFSGLASLANSGSNRKAEYAAILQSESLTTAFIQQN